MRLCRAVGRGYPRSHWGRSRIPPSSIPTGRLGNSTLLLLPGERRLSRGDNCGRRRKRPPGGVPGAQGPPRPAAPEEGPPGPPQLPGRAAPAPPRPAHLQRLAQLQVEGDHAHALQPGREARPGCRRSPRLGGRRAEVVASAAGLGAGQRIHGGSQRPAACCPGNGPEALPGEQPGGGGLGARRDALWSSRASGVDQSGPAAISPAPGGRRSAVQTREKGPRELERPRRRRRTSGRVAGRGRGGVGAGSAGRAGRGLGELSGGGQRGPRLAGARR